MSQMSAGRLALRESLISKLLKKYSPVSIHSSFHRSMTCFLPEVSLSKWPTTKPMITSLKWSMI
jgi:hypothetical protein